ncbi:MAG: 50S ribosomal protein L6 [Gammaproteobacteria bacterium]|nr:MAG: 50S ribosomal protein L6 [Gammaproteobacteria bacterium]
MSRIAKMPVSVPKGVEVTLAPPRLAVKGPKGSLELSVHPDVEVRQDGHALHFAARHERARALAGTMRALANNMVTGVSRGFERRLTLVGVGYRAQVQGNVLNLALGYSHPIEYKIPEGIRIETPSQTEIVVSGADKQKVGQVAAEIRAFRPPEPYKGKGVRYSDEQILRKEAKKK